MDWLLHKYIGIVSTRLEKFKRKGPNLYNFRCPICNDSEKNKSKARGYIYEKQGKLSFHCHNCGASSSVPNFIKTIDQNLYNEMQLEKIKDKVKSPQQIEYETFVEKMKKPIFMKSGPLKGLKKVSQLSPDHPIKKFVEKRKIPNPYHAKLFACPNFMSFVNGILPNKFDNDALKHDEQRLLIPFFDKNKNLFAFQGRSLKSSNTKYITIVLNDSAPKVYGLDTVDLMRRTYVFEGPIDSMFIQNSIATAGGEMIPVLKDFDKSKLVIVYDNEKYSKETVKKIQKAIFNGYSVCIWPDNIEHKDVNDMILSGMSPEFIEHIIESNIFQDLKAQLRLNQWKKVSC